jgi:ATP-dependent Clp protease ATP-binding subunit ClpC
MYERFTDRARKVMQLANQEAQRFNHEYIGTEHILLGLVKAGTGVATSVLQNLDIDLNAVQNEVTKIIRPCAEPVTMGKLPQTPRAKKAIEYAADEARMLHHNYVGSEHLLLGLIREGEGVAAQVLTNLGLTLQQVRGEVLHLLGGSPLDRLETALASAKPVAGVKTPDLDLFGRDLTDLARRGQLNPVIGRQGDLERVLMVLGCLSQNNPVVVGEAGVGKAALVRKLAHHAATQDWPETVRGRRVVAIDLDRTVSADERLFRSAIHSIVAEVRRAGNVLLYVVDLYALVGADRWRAGDSTGILRSALAQADVQCVVTATPREYQAYVASDGFLTHYFQPVQVKPASREEALEILRGLRASYERHHGAVIADDALEAAVELSERHLPDRCLPGKALQVLDQAGAFARLTPPPEPPELQQLAAEVESLTQQKESAIESGDFEKAASFRDRIEKVKKQRAAVMEEWLDSRRKIVGRVDWDTIAKAVRRMGLALSGDAP